jgi:hypothetical protein
MSDDNVTEVTTEGWGGRIGGSFIGALIGVVMVVGSIVLLYWNEGRAVAAIRALDQAGRRLVEVKAEAVDRAADGRLVHLTGMMQAGAPATDVAFGIGGGDLLRLKRQVEMFQWKEQESTRTEKSLGGSETRTTTYSYRKQWSEAAIPSGSFHHPLEHDNPALPFTTTTIDARAVRLGAWRVAPELLAKVSAFQPVAQPPVPAGWQRVGDALYRGNDPSHPAIGDLRVSFSAVPAQTISVVAAAIGGTLTPYRGAGGYEVALASPGLVGGDAMLQQKKHEEGVFTWILRGVGFVVMLIGFVLIGGPLSALAAFVPFLEGIVGAGLFLVALTLAVPLTLLTIAIAWFAHRPLLGAALLALAVGAAIGLRRLHRPRPIPVRS